MGTIADTALVSTNVRLECLERYRALVRGSGEVQSLANTLITDPTPLATLSRLQGLDLAGTAITTIAPLASLTSLQSLYLDQTPLTDATHLPPIPDLRLPSGATPPPWFNPA